MILTARSTVSGVSRVQNCSVVNRTERSLEESTKEINYIGAFVGNRRSTCFRNQKPIKREISR